MDGLLLSNKKRIKIKDYFKFNKKEKVHEISYQMNKKENEIKNNKIKEEIENRIKEKIENNKSEEYRKIENIYPNLIHDKIEITNQNASNEKIEIIESNSNTNQIENNEQNLKDEKIDNINSNLNDEQIEDKNKVENNNSDESNNINLENENNEEIENKSELLNDVNVNYFENIETVNENKIDVLTEKKSENLNKLINDNIELEDNLNKIISQIEKEEEEFQPNSEKLNSEISKLDDNLFKISKDNKNIYNKLSKIKNQVTKKYKEINNFNYPKLFVEKKRKKNDIIDYSSYEQLNNIKNKQIGNLIKTKNILEKDISNLESKIKENVYSKNNLDESYNSMTFNSKSEELKLKIFELNCKIVDVKKEVKELQLLYSKHSECELTKKKLLEILERTKIEYIYLIKNQNKKEIRKKKIEKIKENILMKKRNKFQELQIKKILKKSNSEFDINKTANPKNSINKKLIESLYNEYMNEELSTERISRNNSNHALFKLEEKNVLINFIPLNALEKFERKYKNIFNEKKDYSNKINEEENELKNKKSSLNNLIKENESKNKNYVISSKNFQNQINVNNIEIQNLKRKINETNNEIIKEKKNEIKLIEKNNIVSKELKLVKKVFKDIFNEPEDKKKKKQ